MIKPSSIPQIVTTDNGTIIYCEWKDRLHPGDAEMDGTPSQLRMTEQNTMMTARSLNGIAASAKAAI